MRTIGMLAIPLLVASAGVEAQELNGTTVATARPAISQSSPAQTVSRPPARETFGREVFVSLGRAWLFEGDSLIGKWPSFGAGRFSVTPEVKLYTASVFQPTAPQSAEPGCTRSG